MICTSVPGLSPVSLSEGQPAAKHGAARGNVTFGGATNPRAEVYPLSRGFPPAAVEHTETYARPFGTHL